MTDVSPPPLRVIPCSEWGAVPPKRPISAAGVPTHIIFHHTDGNAPRLDSDPGESLAEARQYARNIQHDHMTDPKKLWIDSGHNFLVTRSGHILEGRHGSLDAIMSGRMVVSAHCPGHNEQPGIEHEHQATQTLTDVQKAATIWLHALICRKTGIRPDAVHPHKEFFNTECPTQGLVAWLPQLEAAVAAALGGGEPASAFDAKTTSELNLRSGASATAAVLLVMPVGTRVHVRALVDDTWAEVQLPTGGTVGFAARRFLTPVAPSKPVAPGSTLIAAPRAGTDAIAAFLLGRGNHEAAGYGEQDVRTIVGYYADACRRGDVDPLAACAQMALETDALGSERAKRPECNPAGIGVTTPGQPGAVFGTWRSAVPAHVGRLLAYALPSGEGTAEQKALIEAAVASRPLNDALRGRAPALRGLGGTWRADPQYGQKIADVANAIRSG